MIADPSGFGFKQLRHFTLDLARNATNFVQVIYVHLSSLQIYYTLKIKEIIYFLRIVFRCGIDQFMS